MRIVSIVLLVLVPFLLSSQEVVLIPLAESFCKPGVVSKSPGKGLSLEYYLQPNVKITDGEFGNIAREGFNRRIRLKFKIPVIHKPHFSFLLGFDHQREQYDFDVVDDTQTQLFASINDQGLKTTRFSAYFIKPINGRFYTSVKLESSFNGDYERLVNFEERYAIHRAAAMIGYKKSATVEYGFGFMYSKGFRKTSYYPFFIYNKTYNKRWGIESVLPVKVNIRYNISDRNMLLVGGEYKSRVYSIDNDQAVAGSSIYNIKRSEVQVSATFKQQLTKWTWFDIKGGYTHNFNIQYDQVTPLPIPDFFTPRPTGGPFIRFSLFVSPPNPCVEYEPRKKFRF